MIPQHLKIFEQTHTRNGYEFVRVLSRLMALQKLGFCDDLFDVFFLEALELVYIRST